MHTLDTFLPQGNMEQRQAVPRRYSKERGTGVEAQEVKRRLGNFDASRSPIARLIDKSFPNSTKSELISVARMTILVARERFPALPQSFTQLDRVIRRSRDLIIKWYHDHWIIIQRVFPDVGLADAGFHAISKHTGLI
jgi:hypothetical protein